MRVSTRGRCIGPGPPKAAVCGRSSDSYDVRHCDRFSGSNCIPGGITAAFFSDMQRKCK